MKTITITLNQEQERLLLDRIKKSTWKLPSVLHKFLNKEYKKPNEWTKKQIVRAKQLKNDLNEEHNQMDIVINQIEKQLEERA